MNILGINGDIINKNRTINDSSVSIVSDGKPTVCISEERLSRIKMDGHFPNLAIAEALKIAGLTINDIDHVAISNLKPVKVNWKYFISAVSTFFDTGVFLKKKIKGFGWNYIYSKLKAPSVDKGTILDKEFSLIYTDHHMAHAAGAYYCSPFDKALVITLDGGGDGLDGSACIGIGNKLTRFMEIPHFQSPGTMYSAITLDMGFKRHKHEGKITGLAAFGNPDIERLGLSRLLTYSKKKHRFISGKVAEQHRDLYAKSKFFYPLFEKFSKEDAAAVCQAIFENETLKFIQDAYEIAVKKGYKFDKICLAGGCFANVKLNQRILETGLFNNLFVFPAMGDDGLSVGSALLAYYQLNPNAPKENSFIDNVYLGGSFSDTQIENALREFGMEYTRVENIEAEVGKILAEGKVVARFNGRMEYGPRALGNRSVLGAPFDKSINSWLNQKFRRTEFMPFAPSIMEEYAADYLEGYVINNSAADFMTITYNIKKGMAEKIPAVVHIDNTARPQIVRKQTNESYHKILNAFYNHTGIPILLNTSFNMHEEPIVYTPADAIRGFLDAKLDYLAIGNFLAPNKKD